MILVTGATGNVGREVVKQLLARRERVRVITRDAKRSAHLANHVETVVGRLEEPATLEAALRGVTAAFLMVTGDAVKPVTGFARAARSAGCSRIAFLSTLYAGERSILLERWHADREDALRDAGVPTAVLRSGAFMTNALQWAGSIHESGVVYDATEGARTGPIAPRDIARVASIALTEGTLDDRTVQLTGAKALTVAEQTAIIASVLGRPLQCVHTSVETAVTTLVKRGVPESFASAIREMLERTRAGRGALLTDAVETITKQRPISFGSWAIENRVAFATPPSRVPR